MRDSIGILILVVLMLMSQEATAADDGGKSSQLIMIEPGRNWSLVGEWDLPDDQSNTFYFEYTLSILRIQDSYVLVWDGDLIAGCCPWPQASPLEQLSDVTFISIFDRSELYILPDSSLTVRYADGRVRKLQRTAPGRGFSAAWK